MEFDHNNVRGVVEDRLSSLPDELIHRILSCFDMKYAVQTCVLSSRWKLLWTSMPCLDFYCWEFGSLPKFSKFVTNVLSHRNHQVGVSCVKLHFSGAASQVFVRKIANYAFSHNVQELTVVCCPKKHYKLPLCLFSSQSLKHFTLSNPPFTFRPRATPKTPWDFPALTTLHLSHITLCDYGESEKSLDLFSRCVNLKNITLKNFCVKGVEVFDIITPRLSNLMLIDGICCSAVINLIAPQLVDLTMIDCSHKYLNAPPGLSSLCYRSRYPLKLSKDRVHTLNEVTIGLYYYNSPSEENARETIKMLQQLHSARYLTLSIDIVECISSFSDLLPYYPSPFRNLICLTIDSSKKKDYKVKMSTEARNFLLGNSPNATLIMELPEEPPTKAMKQKEARAKRKAKQAAELEGHMKDLKALIGKEYMLVERKRAKEKANAALENLMAEVPILSLQKMLRQAEEELEMQVERKANAGVENLVVTELQMLFEQRVMRIVHEMATVEQGKESHQEELQMQVDQGNAQIEQGKVPGKSHKEEMEFQQGMVHTEIERLIAQFKICVGEMGDLVMEELAEAKAIISKDAMVGLLLEKLTKREKAEVEARYPRLSEETKAHCTRLMLEFVTPEKIFAYKKLLSDNISTYQDVSSSKVPLASQTRSSSSTTDFTMEQDSVTAANDSRAVVNANQQFLDIIRERSFSKMCQLWRNADYVKCTHASGELFTGYSRVLESWEQAFNREAADEFQVRDVKAEVLSDVGWVTMKAHNVGMEDKPLIMANWFELHNGHWYMVHHTFVNGGVAAHQSPTT